MRLILYLETENTLDLDTINNVRDPSDVSITVSSKSSCIS